MLLYFTKYILERPEVESWTLCVQSMHATFFEGSFLQSSTPILEIIQS